MKKLIICINTILLMLTVSAVSAQVTEADSNMEIFAEKVKADKKLLVAINLNLNEKEGELFWPIYDEYQAELDSINDKTMELILTYAGLYNDDSLTDDQAINLVNDYTNLEREHLNMKDKYLKRISSALSGKQATRYIQLENKIHAVTRYGLAASIPLVE